MNVEQVTQKLAECREAMNVCRDNKAKWDVALGDVKEKMDTLHRENAALKLGIDNNTQLGLDERTYEHNDMDLKSLRAASLRYRSLIDEAMSNLSHYKRIERELMSQQALLISKRKTKMVQHLRQSVPESFLDVARESLADFLVQWGMKNDVRPSVAMLPSLLGRELEQDTNMSLSKLITKKWDEKQVEAVSVVEKEEVAV